MNEDYVLPSYFPWVVDIQVLNEELTLTLCNSTVHQTILFCQKTKLNLYCNF